MARTLDQLCAGQSAQVEELALCGAKRRRMLDLGFIPGADVRVLQVSPFGDPVAYQVLDTVIALRLCDARRITVAD